MPDSAEEPFPPLPRLPQHSGEQPQGAVGRYSSIMNNLFFAGMCIATPRIFEFD